jgi:adenine phosphoribosyltransferase
VISEDSIKPGDRVLVVDDLLATGGSAKALCELVERSGATVAGVMFYIELTPLKGRELLKKYPVISIVPVEAY